MAMAPGSHAFSQRLSFGYFSLARQRKVTAAPRRGNAKKPSLSELLCVRHKLMAKEPRYATQTQGRSAGRT
ncbi:hypothetical protein, partial [Burkholderia dolosa]|uniref:hypothetical protein n=1 Tax=Burkholderia dolosa TaxID=152500 RepID=UPI001ABB71E0